VDGVAGHHQYRACGHGAVRDVEIHLAIVLARGDDDALGHLDVAARSVQDDRQLRPLLLLLPRLDGVTEGVVRPVHDIADVATTSAVSLFSSPVKPLVQQVFRRQC